MKRNGRLIALGVCAAIGAAFAAPALVGAEGPVSLARNSYALSGFKLSPTGKQPNSVVPTNAKGKFPQRTLDLSKIPWGTTVTGVVGIEFTNPQNCGSSPAFTYSATSRACQNTFGAGVSFPLQAPVPLKAAKVGILGGLNENGECSGSFNAPTAPPGYLCVYPGKTGSAAEYFDRSEADIFNISRNGDGAYAVEVYPLTGNAAKHGFRIAAQGAIQGAAKFYGTWAYTAPGAESAEARAAEATS